MEIEAATLAGGKVNQDYYAYGDTYALVLDGATSFLPEQTSIDAVTYVRALGRTLSSRLKYGGLNEIPNIVADSIEVVAVEYKLNEESSPNSTVVIAKWDQNQVAVYVLGDSSCLVIENDFKVTDITDSRMAQFGDEIRQTYKHRLSAGSGFDEGHKKLLHKLQSEQKLHRNTKDGYWIAGANSEAGLNGLLNKFSLDTVREIWLMSDGGLVSFQNTSRQLREAIPKIPVDQMLNKQYEAEAKDLRGVSFPRSKLHDDKTIVVVKTDN